MGCGSSLWLHVCYTLSPENVFLNLVAPVLLAYMPVFVCVVKLDECIDVFLCDLLRIRQNSDVGFLDYLFDLALVEVATSVSIEMIEHPVTQYVVLLGVC